MLILRPKQNREIALGFLNPELPVSYSESAAGCQVIVSFLKYRSITLPLINGPFHQSESERDGAVCNKMETSLVKPTAPWRDCITPDIFSLLLSVSLNAESSRCSYVCSPASGFFCTFYPMAVVINEGKQICRTKKTKA